MRAGLCNAVGLGGRAILQLAYVVLAARELGADGFGVFATMAAAALVAAPLCGWGANALVLRTLSRGAPWSVELRARAARRDVVSGAGLGAALAAAAPFLLGVPWQLAVAVVLADLLCAPLHELAAHVLQAAEDAIGYAAVMLLHGAGRLAAALALVVAGGDLHDWGWCYAAGSAAALALAWVVVALRRPCAPAGGADLPWSMGGPFVGAGLARVVISDGDKLVLAALAPPAAVAVYGLAMRGVEAAAIPLRAAVVGWIPRFFRAGASGGTAAASSRALPVALLLGLLGAGGLLAVAPLLPLLLGPDYRDTASALMLLAPLVPIRAVQSVYGEALTGADRQWPRTLLLLAAGGAIVAAAAAILLWRPEVGWAGPAVAQLVVGILLAAALVQTARMRRLASHG